VKDEFVKNMQAAGKKLTVKEYNEDHAFANPSNPHYNQANAASAQHISINYLRSCFQ
jgi:carboxymethylenebutenolidase